MSRNVRFLTLGVLVAVTAMIATQIRAQTTPPDSAAAPTAAGTGEAVVQQIVEVTRAVPSGTTAITAYTVPAGSRLVITDVMLTNTAATAACTLTIGRAATSSTGPLCVPARTTLMLSLTTGLEFAPGETVQLTRPSDTTATTTGTATATTTATDTLSVHMRGFLTAG